MRNQRRTLPTKFGAPTRFEPTLSATARGRNERLMALEQLKNKLMRERLEDTWGDRQHAVRSAANEAAALAWVTPYPALVFPLLFEEQVNSALAVADRQDEVFKTSRELLAV